MPSVTVNDSVMHYLERGSAGRPLVLLHAFPIDCRVWENQVAALSDICRVIAPDLPGFGQSPSTGPFTIESVADQVQAFLERISATPCVLGGLSMGGYIALAYARKCPSRLSGIVLADTRAEGDTPQGKQGRAKMIELVRTRGSKAIADEMLPKMLSAETVQRKPDVVRKVRQMMESCPPLTIEHALVALRDREDHTSFLPSIADPTVILVGEHDAITPPAMSESLHRAIAKSELTIIAGAGHLSPIEQPEQVNAALRRFITALPA